MVDLENARLSLIQQLAVVEVRLARQSQLVGSKDDLEIVLRVRKRLLAVQLEKEIVNLLETTS